TAGHLSRLLHDALPISGGTNALRALGRRWAAVVVVGDLAKGAVPVLVARALTGDPAMEVLAGFAAVVGSSRSIFLRFGGGRGVISEAHTSELQSRVELV